MKPNALICAAAILLQALASGGCGSSNDPAPSGSASVPEAPSDLTATLLAGPAVHVTWKDRSSNEESFVLERKMEGEQFTVLTSPVFNETAHHDADVMAKMTYTYRIAAKNAQGQSPYSNEVSASVP